MNVPSPTESREEEIDLRDYFAILRKAWWKIGLFSMVVGILTLIVMLRVPNVYQATAVISPETDERRQNHSLGALASIGIDVGGQTRVEDLEILFKSNDLAVRVFKKYNIWPILLGDAYDPATGGIKVSGKGSLLGGEKKLKPLGEWDAIRAAKVRLQVSVGRKTNTISISFESPTAEGSAEIVNHFLEEGKNHLQEETLNRATKNKKFIEEQIGKTVDALNRDRLYSLLGQEVEREMMARNREQFGFRVIDSPRVPDRKSKPQRARAAIQASVVSFFIGWLFYVLRGIGQKKKYPKLNAYSGK
ncbi:MAG: hypothetical protein C4523_03085 [Myxococcales bacterium]|nr:MAG: hypothetical protein C4523_03085 [Myxococcales bacterium]